MIHMGEDLHFKLNEGGPVDCLWLGLGGRIFKRGVHHGFIYVKGVKRAVVVLAGDEKPTFILHEKVQIGVKLRRVKAS